MSIRQKSVLIVVLSLIFPIILNISHFIVTKKITKQEIVSVGYQNTQKVISLKPTFQSIAEIIIYIILAILVLYGLKKIIPMRETHHNWVSIIVTLFIIGTVLGFMVRSLLAGASLELVTTSSLPVLGVCAVALLSIYFYSKNTLKGIKKEEVFK